MDDCSRAIQLDPTHEKAHLRKGYLPSREPRVCDCRACACVSLVCFGERLTVVWRLRGSIALFELGEYEMAHKVFAGGQRINQKRCRLPFFLGLARCHHRHGRTNHPFSYIFLYNYFCVAARAGRTGSRDAKWPSRVHDRSVPIRARRDGADGPFSHYFLDCYCRGRRGRCCCPADEQGTAQPRQRKPETAPAPSAPRPGSKVVSEADKKKVSPSLTPFLFLFSLGLDISIFIEIYLYY